MPVDANSPDTAFSAPALSTKVFALIRGGVVINIVVAYNTIYLRGIDYVMELAVSWISLVLGGYTMGRISHGLLTKISRSSTRQKMAFSER